MKINIIYWTGSGNTEEMAKLIKLGAEEAKASVNLLPVDKATEEDIVNCDILCLGSPAMGAETIDETEMEPFLNMVSDKLSGKDVILFGSYGWGSGEWMTTWEDDMIDKGVNLLEREVIANEFPEGDDAEKLIELGRKIGK